MKAPDAPVLDQIFDPIGRILSPDVARKLVDWKLDRKAQARLDALARKCNDGRLSDDERREYETYVRALDFIAVLQAKARKRLRPSAAET
jgi:hypothetical protein